MGKVLIQLELCDPAEGANARRGRPPVTVLPVLSALQEVLVSPVAGEVVEDPGAIGHCAGVSLAQLVGVRHRWAVIGALHHLPAEVRLLVELQFPSTAVNLKNAKHWKLNFLFYIYSTNLARRPV